MSERGIRAMIRLGRYKEIGERFADVAALSDPGIVLERARALILQGQVDRAATLLDAALGNGAHEPGAWSLVALERAGLHIYREGDYIAALRDAGPVVDAARSASAPTTILARLDRVHARIVLSARIQGAVAEDIALGAVDRLEAAVDTLAKAGEVEESLVARQTGLCAGIERPWSLYDGVSRDASAAGLPTIAADAMLAAARVLRARGYKFGGNVRQLAREARRLYTTEGHAHGALDVDVLLALIDEDDGTDTVPALLQIAKAYEVQDHVTGAYGALEEIVGVLLSRGVLHRHTDIVRVIDDLPRRVGLGIAAHNMTMRLAAISQRQGRYSESIRWLRRGLDASPPACIGGALEIALGQIYGILGLPEKAAAHRSRAAAVLGPSPRGIPAEVRDLVTQSDGLAAGFDPARWRADVEQTLEQQEVDSLAVQVLLDRFLVGSGGTHSDPSGVIDRLIEAGVRAASILPFRQRRTAEGNLLQRRAHLHTIANEREAALVHWRQAIAAFTEARLSTEIANSNLRLGALHLACETEAASVLTEHFAAGETALKDALKYYVDASMRKQSAEARLHLATLWLIAADKLVLSQHRPSLIEAALDMLERGEREMDLLRYDFLLEDVFETQSGKLAIVQGGERMYTLAIHTCLVLGDTAAAWEWARRRKSRVLLDLLVRREAPGLESEPAARLAGDATASRPSLAEILTAANSAARPAAHPLVLVDWRVQGDEVVMFTLRSDDMIPRSHPIALRASNVAAFVALEMGAPARRFRDGSAKSFNDLAPLVAPLADVAQEDDRILLSPSGPMGRLPLHALPLGGQPLLVRHPVAYTPSLDLLPSLAARTRAMADAPRFALFGDPQGNSKPSRAMVEELAQRFGRPAWLGADATADAMAMALGDADVVHFQGHARFNGGDPLESGLIMSDTVLTAADLFRLAPGHSRLVVLAACESAVSAGRPGDESLGILRGLFFAGAQAVIGTLWPVSDGACGLLMREFYRALYPAPPAHAPSVAEALRVAVLVLRENPDMGQRLYSWAPFFVSGHAL